MNYEQKYKEALETVQEILSSGADAIRIKTLKLRLQSVFPELKEREEESIRKAILALIEFGLEDKSAIAPGYNVIKEDAIAWLEKQGVQKPADKDEPKFKVGDWVVQENIGVYKVIEICESWYEVVDNKDKHYSIGFDKEYMCHLWTIQDAKDGDVLANTAGCVLIIKDNESCVCYINKNGEFCADNNKWLFANFTDNVLAPATKEQRDLLFQKMKEAGCEWDSEKKELKKFESKTLEPDKVIEWLGEHVPTKFEDMQNYVNQFKQDFGL